MPVMEVPEIELDAEAPEVEIGEPSPSMGLPVSAMIEAPLGKLDAGYLSRHVEARLTTRQQQEGLRRLLNGLRDASERLADGKTIESNADAVRWFLEQLAAV